MANPVEFDEILVNTSLFEIPAEMTFRKPIESRVKQELRDFERQQTTAQKVAWILNTLQVWPLLLKEVFELRHKNKRVKDMAKAAAQKRRAEKAKEKKKKEQANKKAKERREAKKKAKEAPMPLA